MNKTKQNKPFFYTPENEDFEPQNGGLVQIYWMIFEVPGVNFSKKCISGEIFNHFFIISSAVLIS